MNSWEKCKTCKNLDKEKSTDNWIVCPKLSVQVILAETSKNCKQFKNESNCKITWIL